MEKSGIEPYQNFISAAQDCLQGTARSRLYLQRGTASFYAFQKRPLKKECMDRLDAWVTQLACRLIQELQYLGEKERAILVDIAHKSRAWPQRRAKSVARLEAQVRALFCRMNEEPIVQVSSDEEDSDDSEEFFCPAPPSTPRLTSRLGDGGLVEALFEEIASGDTQACDLFAAIIEMEQGRVLLDIQPQLSTVGSRLSRHRRLERSLSEVEAKVQRSVRLGRVSFREQLAAVLAKPHLEQSYKDNPQLVKELVEPLLEVMKDADFRANAMVAQLLHLNAKQRAGFAQSLLVIAHRLIERQSYHAAATVYLALNNAVTAHCGKSEGWYESLEFAELKDYFSPVGNFRVLYRRMCSDLEQGRSFFPFLQPLVSNLLGLLENKQLEASDEVVRTALRLLSAGCVYAETAQTHDVHGVAAAMRGPERIFDPRIKRDSASLDATWKRIKAQQPPRGSLGALKRLCSTCTLRYT